MSVLIPVWNGADCIERAVASVAAQTLTEVEVIVIDDASTDATAPIVAAVASRDPRVHLLSLPRNAGPGAARTLGLQSAKGRWISVLDADDTMAPERLERLVREAEAASLDVIADNLELVDPGTGDTVGSAFPLGPKDWVVITPERFIVNTRPGCRVNLGWMQPVMRRDFLTSHRITWPPLRHAEDMVFTMRLLRHGARMGLTGAPLYRYTQRRGTRSGQRSTQSRTVRSVTEQHAALDLCRDLARDLGISPSVQLRLARMKSEIAATARALDLVDAIQERSAHRATKAIAGLLAHPLALARILHGRFLVGHRIL